MDQPNFTEAQWRIIYDTMEAATPLDAKPESRKDRLAWYERSEIIQSIKSHFGWRSRTTKKAEKPEDVLL